MKKILLFVALSILAGCSEPPETVRVSITYVKDEAELKQMCGDDMVVEPLGCAKASGQSCRIIAYRPRGYDDHRRVETLGHELMHCFWGPVHT